MKPLFIVLSVIIFVFTVAGSYSQVKNKAHSTMVYTLQQSRERRVQELQQKIQHLQQEIVEQQLQLAKLQNEGVLPHQTATSSIRKGVAQVTFMSQGIFGVSRGKQDGLRRGDHLIILHRTQDTMIFTGFGIVYNLLDKELNAAGENFGFAPEDEVYVCNRDNSPYSLSKIHVK